MIDYIKQVFGRRDATRVLQQQRDEAMLLAVEYKAAAEHYQALTAMYELRVQRIDREMARAHHPGGALAVRA